MSKNRTDLKQANDQVTETAQEDKALPFWRVMLSVFQAAFGVQNQNNRERDFRQGSIVPFVIAALVFTVLFIVALIMIVRFVLG